MNLAYATIFGSSRSTDEVRFTLHTSKESARGSRYNDTRRIRANILVEYLQCSSSGLESFSDQWLGALPWEALPPEVAVGAGLLVDRRSEVQLPIQTQCYLCQYEYSIRIRSMDIKCFCTYLTIFPGRRSKFFCTIARSCC